MLVVHFVGAPTGANRKYRLEMAYCLAARLHFMRLFLQPSMGAAHVLLRFLLRASFSLFFLIRQYVLYRKGNNHAVPKSEQLLAR